MKLTRRHDLSRFALVLLATYAMAGCGGGGGSSQSVQPPAQPGTANSPPTIQGQPASTIAVGQQYVFQPTANDPDGDALSFSVSNAPTGAVFNNSTGRLAWTPTSAQVGAYANIQIRVSDARGASATLNAFTITVSDVVTGSATISWTPPTLNTDGSALTDLAGYEIRYGRSSSALDRSVAVNTPGLTTYLIENLSSGTWYFSVSSRNAQGIVSTQSEVASKVIS